MRKMANAKARINELDKCKGEARGNTPCAYSVPSQKRCLLPYLANIREKSEDQ